MHHYLDDDTKPDSTRDEEIAGEVSLHEVVLAADAARAAVVARRAAEQRDYASAVARFHEGERAHMTALISWARQLIEAAGRTFDARDHLYTFLALARRDDLGRALLMSERREMDRLAVALWPSVRRVA